MQRLRWVVLLSVAMLTGCKHHPDTRHTSEDIPGSNSNTSVANAALALADAQRKLLAMQSTPMETDVPASIQAGTVRLKEALVALTDSELATMPVNITDKRVGEVLQALLLPASPKSGNASAGKATSKEDSEKPESGNYGDDVSAIVTSSASGMLLVQESFGIMCGQDNVLLGYSNVSGKWKRILRWQAPPYKQVSGAYGDWYETRLLAPQRNGHPVLLVVHGTPWCTSTMSAFSMDSLELNPDTKTETAFFHASHGYRRADDDPPASLKVTQDGFEVRASVNDWDMNRISRKGVMRYRMAGNTLQRTLPIAMNARESVNEWIEEMHHDEAALFTDAPAGSRLWQMWQTLTYDGKPEGAMTPLTDYGDVRACTDSLRHFQVEIDTSIDTPGEKPSTPGPRYYVQVEEAGNGYLLHDAPTFPNPVCAGRVVMPASASAN